MRHARLVGSPCFTLMHLPPPHDLELGFWCSALLHGQACLRVWSNWPRAKTFDLHQSCMSLGKRRAWQKKIEKERHLHVYTLLYFPLGIMVLSKFVYIWKDLSEESDNRESRLKPEWFQRDWSCNEIRSEFNGTARDLQTFPCYLFMISQTKRGT